MKVLFVCSGNSEHFEMSPIIRVQADSLISLGIDLEFYLIKGKGIFGYLQNVFPLRSFIRAHDFHAVHAHYSLCAIVMSLTMLFTGAGCSRHKTSNPKKNTQLTKPIKIVSLMGSDVESSFLWRLLIRFFSHSWDSLIVKSKGMKSKIGIDRAVTLPNGVNLEEFRELDQVECRMKLGLNVDRKYILFAADPNSKVKNFPLARSAFSQLFTDNCKLITLGGVTHSQVPLYLNACDVVLLTSLWEGSPNVIKEAMACNRPIVSTNVGDVSWLFGDLKGHYIAKPTPEEVSSKLEEALKFEGRTKGEERLIELGLDSETVARKLFDIYQKACKDKET